MMETEIDFKGRIGLYYVSKIRKIKEGRISHK